MIYHTCPYCHARIAPKQRCSCPGSMLKRQHYGNTDYKHNRDSAIEKTGGRCNKCDIVAFEMWSDGWHAVNNGAVHHKVPLWMGGTDDTDNLEPLCGACHAQEDAAIRRGGV
jgi:predicted HNH restriction endonuclease